VGNKLTTPHCQSIPDYEIFRKISDEVAGFSECDNEILVFTNFGNLVTRYRTFGARGSAVG